MAKLTLTDLANLQNETTAVSTINNNSSSIETALENTLSRDGTSPNTMGASLDMNSNRIINLPTPLSNNEPARKVDLDTLEANVDQIALDAAVAAAELAEDNAHTSELLADADATQTALDRIATAADRVQTGLDAVATAADRVQTGLDKTSTITNAATATTQAGIATAQAVLTAADRVQTGLDRVQTGADRVQTGLDAISAAASAAAAALSADTFDDTYLGSKASNPTLDNDGNALVEGQLYWNNASNGLRVYDGTAWQNYNPLSGLANLVEDTTPQLGGNLDVNGFGITGYLTVGAGNSAYQPLDADLTAIAALTTTAAGRTALTLADPGADRVMIWDESAGSGGAYVAATLNDGLQINGTVIRQLEKLEIALSDETTAITTGTNKATYSFPYSITFVGLPYATLNTVSSSGTPTVDINEAGTTLLSTKLTIDVSEKTSGTAAVAAVVSDAVVAANAEIGFDIDVAGTGAKGLKVSWDYYRT